MQFHTIRIYRFHHCRSQFLYVPFLNSQNGGENGCCAMGSYLILHWYYHYSIETSFTVEFKCLKTLDTIGNCQRSVFSLGVSQHVHKITNLWKFELDWSSELRDNYERQKHPSHTKLCAFRCLISRPQVLNLRSRNRIRGKLLLSRKLYVTSEGAVSHNVLYYQPLPITK